MSHLKATFKLGNARIEGPMPTITSLEPV